ncbi:MAG: asparagine synthase (glutamine-hydrolyzing) [Candidatus Dormibacteria bacterium]
MCGICGFYGRRDSALLRDMTAAQLHRGPNGDGFHETSAASLGFRRLSIIDLATGDQPISTDGGRLTIIYNGEIYNYRELRADLEAQGRTFQTSSDTEVALHAFAAWGPTAFSRFNGMWALALLDERGSEPRLILCRDHFGIKPLFYAQHDDRVVFASEIKSILQDATFPRRVDEQQLYEYLAWGLYDHNDLTFFAGIQQVPAAAYAVVDGGGVSVHRYWDPVLNEDADPDPAEFRRLFTKAVERRLVADVPVGTCLSGGLDSSSIVCVMDQLLAARVPDSTSLGGRLKTFSAIFPGDPIDEKPYMDAVLAVTAADPTWVKPTSEQWIEELEAWIWFAEEPMVSTAPYAMWSVMRAASEKVTVLLDGQAGDELLAGYVPYQYVYLRQLLRDKRYVDFARESAKALDTVGPLVRRRLWERRRGVRVPSLLRKTWTRELRTPCDPRIQDDLKKRLLQDLQTFSLPSLLRYEDRNSMAHSVESRLPFLDQELVEWILRLPASALVGGGWSRAILRDGFRGLLPERVRTRRKKIGFTTPEFRWFRQQRPAIQSLMRSPSFASRPFWNAERVADAFRVACAGGSEESMFFWRAVNVEIWMRLYIDSQARSLDDSSWHLGFVGRGDRAAAPGTTAQPLLAAVSPNPGRHLLIQRGAQTWARIPVRSSLVRPGDDLGRTLIDALRGLAERGVQLEDGDVVALSEKVVSITQGRSLPMDEIAVTPLARLLSRFVSRVPIGIGLGRPQTMQLAIEEAGVPRIIAAAAAAAVTRPLGVRGVFYRVAGPNVAAIDGPTAHTIPPYNTHASKAPEDADRVAGEVAGMLLKRSGVDVDVAVVDTNDLAADILGTSRSIDRPALGALFADNPLGQTDEQTPFAVLRRIRSLPQNGERAAVEDGEAVRLG